MNYFTQAELSCKCGCETYKFDKDFLVILNSIREVCGFPLPVSSGYRCQNHPIERNKEHPGEHTQGLAVDIKVSGWKAYDLLKIALDHDIRRIGISQSGDRDRRFIHLGASQSMPSPVIWSY